MTPEVDASDGPGGPAGPIVIGGLGGSGTRLVARLAIDAGVFLGSDLNASLDHLGFTLLFKRPRWLARAERERPDEVARALSILERSMVVRPADEEGRGGARFSSEDRALVRRAAVEMAWRGHDHRGRGRLWWPFLRARRLLHGTPPAGIRAWGWKEPNAHVVLEALADRFHGLRFVYVARHGLDMAYASNRAQLFHWGERFGVRPARGEDAPRAQLAYWVRAAERARAIGRERLGERFLWLDYDHLCLAPAVALPPLLAFLGAPFASDPEAVERLAANVRPPASRGRHLREDRSALDPEDVRVVARLGFPVEGA